MRQFEELKNSLNKSGLCPLCNEFFVGLKNHFRSCYYVDRVSEQATHDKTVLIQSANVVVLEIVMNKQTL